MPDSYHIVLAACLLASLCWLAVLLRVWIRMRDELRRERDHFRDSHITTCRQLREAIEDGQAARAERDQACEAEAEWQRNCSASARREYDLVERLKISQREELARRREIEILRAGLRELSERAIPGNPRAIAGQSGWVDDGSSLTHCTDLGGWIPVGDNLPTEDDLDDWGDVLVAVRSDAGGEPWTDRAYLDGGVWKFSRGDREPNPGVRITHWMLVPLPPGATSEVDASCP